MNDSSLRILLLIKSLAQGGAERQCSVLAGQLAEAGHSVCVVVYDNTDTFYKALLPGSVQLVSLNSSRWNVPSLLFGLLRQIYAFKPDVVYGFMSHSNLLLLLSGVFTRAKLVCGVRASKYDMRTEPVLQQFGEWLHRNILHFADLIIVNSDAGKCELIESGLPYQTTIVVANGIDTKRFAFDAGARSDIRRSLGFSDADCVIGQFARFHPMKGHAILLQAFSVVAAEDPCLKMLLIGSGDRLVNENAIKASGLSGRVTLLNQFSDIERYYSAIDLYCSPSLYGEGFPNALSEAMATGLECIATDIGDSALIISNYGQLVVAGDVQQLTDAIRSRSSGRNEVDAEVRRQHIVRNFGLRQLGERTIVAMRKTLES